MCEEVREHPGSVFHVMVLESMYIDLLKMMEFAIKVM